MAFYMLVDITKTGQELRIKVLHPRIDGDNFIIKSLKEKKLVFAMELVEFDLDSVEYVNSLGITEFVNIHRMYTEISRGKTRFRFINVDKKVNAILELVEVQKLAEIVPKP